MIAVIVVVSITFFFALFFLVAIINVFLNLGFLPIVLSTTRQRDSGVLARHDNWTRYARPSEHGATAHTLPGLPS